MLQVLDHLKDEWGERVADEFLRIVYTRIHRLQMNPFIGAPAGVKTVRSLHVTKHNRIYYRIEGNKVVILNLYDTRSNKKKLRKAPVKRQ